MKLYVIEQNVRAEEIDGNAIDTTFSAGVYSTVEKAYEKILEIANTIRGKSDLESFKSHIRDIDGVRLVDHKRFYVGQTVHSVDDCFEIINTFYIREHYLDEEED